MLRSYLWSSDSGRQEGRDGGSQLKGEPVIAASENFWVVPSLAFLEQRL